jgi:hypothetical protein
MSEDKELGSVRMLNPREVARLLNLMRELKTLVDSVELRWQDLRVLPDNQRPEAQYAIGLQRSIIKSAYDDLRRLHEILVREYSL